MHFVPGKLDGPPSLDRLGWKTIGFKDGRLTLGRLYLYPGYEANRRCARVWAVQVGPPDGRFRRVSVLAEVNGTPCRGRGPTIVLEPAGWTRDTVATPTELDVPNAQR